VEHYDLPQKWAQATTLDHAKSLVDIGVILSWKEARRLSKALPEQDYLALTKHFAERFCEFNETRLPQELLAESLLNWISSAPSEKTMQVFLEAFLSSSNRTDSCFKLVEVILTVELSEQTNDETLFAAAVSLICELGLAVKEIDIRFPGEIQRAPAIIDHVATYLLSVSNTNNSCIRLSLLNYFGNTEAGIIKKHGFNKILGRFGHTVLDHLFYLLFKKKTEAVALQYLLENLPYILEADRHAQRIVHETWKFYMLKKPDRFALFLKTFASHYKAMDPRKTVLSRKVFFQHLGALLRVTSEVNHKQLTQVILSCFTMFESHEDRNQVLDEIMAMEDLRKSIRDMIVQLRQNSEKSTKVIDSASRFANGKRGRKPSFARIEGWVTVNQVNFLGSQPPAVKAS
jgi:hypothetical protein